MSDLFDLPVATAEGGTTTLEAWRGQVLLIVNVASRCGFTPQYAGLEALQREYAGRGFSVLGFPCNQFSGQEPGDAARIAAFCATTYGVSFPVFGKIAVNGADTAPVYGWLKRQQAGLLGVAAIKWNFSKFLVGRDGRVRVRAAPATTPDQLRPAITQALGEPALGRAALGKADPA